MTEKRMSCERFSVYSMSQNLVDADTKKGLNV